ncbi:Glucose-6-phosphate 1-dehydrogenase [Nymphon striatum]|nr:Glucose-6-phosphate 1-dehydrogenase [Nymphon striatum]
MKNSTKTTLDNCTFVIFGATGNLARTKLMPALYHLDEEDLLPTDMKIVGLGRRIANRDEWKAELYEDIKAKARGGIKEDIFEKFAARLDYLQISLKEKESYQTLAEFLGNSSFPENIAFYFSLPPTLYGSVVQQLGKTDLLQEKHGWRRVVVEKPFGYNLESARNLQHQFDKHLVENQIYRIDHYLGKETVQNLQVFRFANLLLEPLWNRNYIDHVQITHAETIGIGSRGSYFDQTGALRDMIQSHLLQLLSLVAMEPPVSMGAEDLRDEKYAEGKANGKKINGYLDEKNIPEESVTETFAALKLHINNWRWRGVPFYLRTGKRLAEKRSMIAICFRHPPKQFFRTSQFDHLKPNWLLIGIQPDETLRMELTVKKPGLGMETQSISLDTHLNNKTSKDAYEGLLLDVIEGDHSLFLRSDEVEHSWKIVDPILRYWGTQTEYIQTYGAGTWGPDDAHRLFEEDGQHWRCTLNPDECTD